MGDSYEQWHWTFFHDASQAEAGAGSVKIIADICGQCKQENPGTRRFFWELYDAPRDFQSVRTHICVLRICMPLTAGRWH